MPEQRLDPDITFDRLYGVMACYTDSPVDAYWTAMAGWDPREREASRLRQKMYLARYARIDPFEWAHRDLDELDAHFEMLCEIIAKEGASAQSEDSK